MTASLSALLSLKVETSGLEARDQRSEFSEDAVDLRDAHLGEHGLRHFRRFARELAVRCGEAERRLIGEADADEALRLGAFEGGFGKSRGGERESRCRQREASGPLQQVAARDDRSGHAFLPETSRLGPGLWPGVFVVYI